MSFSMSAPTLVVFRIIKSRRPPFSSDCKELPRIGLKKYREDHIVAHKLTWQYAFFTIFSLTASMTHPLSL